ncbi:hypothetical protein [Streptomyces triticirhizae]|uniref:hypothetical protein n=1 Tax=Streptomyces triticirhizae TaxID=2483353 RepID=UPI0018F4D9B9|nr:hypothetical protein [Streptomyces triticirhizae]
MIVIDQKPARLLPWSDDQGRPCYLAGNGGGRVTEYANALEREQMLYAEAVLGLSADTIDDTDATREDLLDLSTCLTAALRDVHRIARSRGEQLDYYTELAAQAEKPEDAEEEWEDENDEESGAEDRAEKEI